MSESSRSNAAKPQRPGLTARESNFQVPAAGPEDGAQPRSTHRNHARFELAPRPRGFKLRPMDLFKSSDDSFAEDVLDAAKRRDALAKARLNRVMTLGGAAILFIAFLAMSYNRAPSAEIFGALAVINFALFLKSDSDVKLMLAAEKLLEKRAAARPDKPIN